MQNLPIGIQSFEKLRKSNFKYIDKTRLIHQVASDGKYYFLSRPRRFGKSLLLSTLKAYFEGKKHLFEGLAIAQIKGDETWDVHPVLHLDLNTRNYSTPEALEEELNKHLERWEALYGDKYQGRKIEERFDQIIRLAYEKTGKQVVILVDEYDKPILQTIGNEALQNHYRTLLKSFYAALKSCDEFICLAFLTGVTKFGKVSVFSDLNNLVDISQLPQYYDICGITEEELHSNFNEHIAALSDVLHCSEEEVYLKLKTNYDGYRFTSETVWNGQRLSGIYNPFSLLNALHYSKIKSFWFETGTPTYLVELLKKHHYNLQDLRTVELAEDELNSIDASSLNPLPVIYQSGYLTIKDYDARFNTYTLCYPNKEVEEGFVKFLIPYYTNVDKTKSTFEITQFIRSLERGDAEGFMQRLQTFLAACPYELEAEQERHLQSVMYILTTLCGFYTEVETHTNKGRIDLTIKTDNYIYLFELKFNDSASAAIAQIEAKGYAKGYKLDGRALICIGANYAAAERNLNEWIIR